MSISDRAFRTLAQKYPELVQAVVTELGVLARGAEPMHPEDVDDPKLLTPVMEADFVGRASNNEVVHVECQGYRDTNFDERVLKYHLVLVVRYWDRRVRTLAVWLMRPPKAQLATLVRHGDVRANIQQIVIPDFPASRLLANPATVMWAPAADPEGRSDDELCELADVGETRRYDRANSRGRGGGHGSRKV